MLHLINPHLVVVSVIPSPGHSLTGLGELVHVIFFSTMRNVESPVLHLQDFSRCILSKKFLVTTGEEIVIM